MATATATVLFTDVQESTEVRVRVGEAAADALFLDLERTLGALVERYGGRVLKTAGDGLMASFESASDAVAAAVEMQQAVWRRNDVLIRVGIAAGDVRWEGDDCFGFPVVTAARLQAAATGGQILVSQVVRWLAGERSSAAFEPAGALELKGLPEPVEAFSVTWSQFSEEECAVPLPPALAAPPELAFVGRDVEWGVLEEQWRRVVAGGRAVVLVGGEAGAGKTRLASEFARRCRDDGAAVLFGGCDADLMVPYQPWVQALDHLLRTVPARELDADVLVDLGVLAPLLPSLDRARSPDRPSTIDPESERYRLFGAVDAVLAEGARRWPLVIVLDDLHWATSQTLALLSRIARAGTCARTLILATFRDTGDELTDPLSTMLADLRRVEGCTRVRVGGLDADAVASLIAHASGHELGADLGDVVASVTERSRGNAFFVGELWRHLVTSGVVSRVDDRWVVQAAADGAGVPESVRDVVSGRLARLTFPVRRLAELVAVAGSRVDLQVLHAAADVTAAELTTSLDELVTADLLEAFERPRLMYQFTHALVRDTVEAGVPPAARAGLHLRIGEALEVLHEADRRPIFAELARHFAAAASLGTVGKAVYYGRQAANQALQSAALEEARAHCETVLVLSEPLSAARVEALLTSGRIEGYLGQFDAMRKQYEAAFELACRLEDVRLIAEAAMGYEDAIHTPGLPGGPAVRVVELAIELVGGGCDPPMRARLEAALARALTHAGRLVEARRTVESAMALANETGDADAKGAALEAALIATSDPRRMLEYSAELDAIAGAVTNTWRSSYSSVNRMRAWMMLGEFDHLRSEIQRHWSLGRQSRMVLVQVQALAFELSLAVAGGRLDDAEALAERAFELSKETGDIYAPGVYGMQMFAIRRAQGRLAEVRPVLEAVSRQGQQRGVWRPGLAVLYAELGMLDDARRCFDDLAVDGFAAVPRDSVWPGCATFLAEVCVVLRDVDRAGQLYEESALLAGQNVMVGMTVCLGPADRWLGGLAALCGRRDVATAHFETALAMTEHPDGRAWRAQCQYDLARVHADDGDAHGAAAIAAEALDLATELGMASLAARCRDLVDTARLEVVAPASSFPDGLSAREVEVLRLVAAGCSNREIGERLLISANTAANHVRAILQKTSCSNRAEAATFAARNGLLAD